MDLADHPFVQELADTDTELLRFFGPLEKVLIQAAKDAVGVEA